MPVDSGLPRRDRGGKEEKGGKDRGGKEEKGGRDRGGKQKKGGRVEEGGKERTPHKRKGVYSMYAKQKNTVCVYISP